VRTMTLPTLPATSRQTGTNRNRNKNHNQLQPRHDKIHTILYSAFYVIIWNIHPTIRC
jgi:hypothetical protein